MHVVLIIKNYNYIFISYKGHAFAFLHSHTLFLPRWAEMPLTL